MADTQIATSGPEGSLPPSMINPDTTVLPQPQPSTLVSGLSPPKPTLPQSAFDPVVANLGPKPAPTPAPTTQPTTAPAVAPPTTPQPAPTQQPTAPNQWRAVGDSIARGYQKFGGASGTGVDIDANNRTVDAAGGRPPSVVLDYLKSLPDGAFSGQNIRFSTGVSNNPGEINLVPEQLAQLKRLGAANVQVVGVGDRAGEEGGHYYDLSSYNAQLEQDSKAAGMTFGGALPAIVHPAPDYYRQHGAQPQQPPTPGTGKTIDDATAFIQQKEGGGPFVLYGHEGQSYDPNSMPTKPGYYGFPDWAGGYGPDGRQTHAAGGAQWEPDTWKTAVEGFTQAGLAAQLGHTPDFRNPQDQKAVFNYWAARRYREQTGRDIVADLNAGHVDWGALGSEWSSLKYAGTGGVAGMTAGNLPTYQEYAALSQQQRELLQQEMSTLQKSIAGMEAGDPKQRALADQLMQKQLQLMDKYEDMIAHPPTQKPQDMMSNFGSIATLIGILGGRFAHRPMVASLNAAGAAMQAINDNNYEAYQNAFNQWKTQAGMTSTLLGMESSAYKNIMEDKRLDMDEKFKLLDAQMQVFQNAQGMLASQRGDLDKQWEIAEKTQELADRHDAHVKQLVEANEKQEQDTAIRNAAAEDDRAWLKDHPEANGVVPDSVHLDNLARRRGEISEAGKAPTAALEGEREVTAAVQADDQKWLADNKPADGKVPPDVHYQHYIQRKTQLAGASAAGIRASNNPQTLAMQKFLEENPGADSKQIQEFIQRMHPGRSGIAMAVTKFMEEHPDATSADIANFYGNLQAQVSADRNWATGPLGNTVRSIDVSIDHLATLGDLSSQLNNTGSQTFNLLQNKLRTEFGDPAVPNFDTAKVIVGAEVTKAIEGGAGALTDREELRNSFNAASTPAQLTSVIETLKRLMAGQLQGLRLQYMQSTGRDDFDDKLSDEAKKELGALSPSRGGGGTGSAPTKPAWADPGYTDTHQLGGRFIWPQGGKWYFDDHTPVPAQ